MGLFNLFKKSDSKSFSVSLENAKSGTIEKEPSYMMAVPKDASILSDMEAMIERIKTIPDVKVLAKRISGEPSAVVSYKDAEYEIQIFVEDYTLPKLFCINHQLTKGDMEILQTANKGVSTKLLFSENNMDSFHLQIKVLAAMVPDMAGVIDISGERILSGKWAALSASSKVPPAPLYLYGIQAVNNNKDFWLHTHGLHRCGCIELEILNATHDNYSALGNLVTTLADMIVSNGEFQPEGEPFFAGSLQDGSDIVATWLSIDNALAHYPNLKIGGRRDRMDGHNENTGAIFLYTCEEDYENHVFTPASILSKYLDDNPIFMKTSKETDRMKALAIERLSYLKKMLDSPMEKAILVKIGLEVDEEFKNGDMKEHIWFELQSMTDSTLTGELTQEPYYVKALHPGSIGTYPYEDLTDWVIYTKKGPITPDSVYLLENEVLS